MEEKITHTDTLYDGRVVRLDIHRVELPNGEESKREVVVHPGAVAIIAVEATDTLLLVRQFRLPAGKIVIEIPAGTLDPDETPENCAIRELQEETGYKPGKLESIGGMYTAPGYTTEYIHLFVAHDLVESSLDPDTDEFIEVERIKLPDALRMIESGDIEDAKTVTGILRFASRLNIL